MINSGLLFETKGLRKFYDESFYFCKKKLSYRKFNGAQIQPEIFLDGKKYSMGVFDNGNFVFRSYSLDYLVRGKIKSPVLCHNISTTKVIYIGPLIKCWGHFITDCLSSLWFFLQEGFSERYSDYRIAYIPDEGFQLKGNYSRLFELLGIEVSKLIPIDKPTIFEEVIIPDCSFFSIEPSDTRVFTDEYRMTVDIIKLKVDIPSPIKNKKIYFTNSSYTRTKKSFGLVKLDEYFRKQGFEIIHPELYTFDEQISMIKNAEFFASTDGSCGHNSVFLNDGAKAIIIPRGPDLTGYQECLCFVHKIDVNYIESTLSLFTPKKRTHVGPMYYYVSEELMSFFGETVDDYKKYCKNNFYDLKKYIKYGLSIDRDFNTCTSHSDKLWHYLSLINRQSLFFKIKNKLKAKFRR